MIGSRCKDGDVKAELYYCPNAFASSHPFSCCFAVLTGVLLVEIVTYTVGDVVGE